MMSNKENKVIHVDKLVIHAKEVEIIQENNNHPIPERRNPWGAFWGGQRRNQETTQNLNEDKVD
jgi:hypothetical protein